MVTIVDQVVMSGFGYFGFTVVGRAHYPNSFDIVEKGINFGHLAHTVALVVW